MSDDKVSSLYAEIGFKVNKQGITEAKSLLTDFANQIKTLNASAQNRVSPFALTKAEKEALKAHRQEVKLQLAQDRQKLNEQKANQKAAMDLRKQEAKEQDNLSKQELAKQKEANRQANQDIKNGLALRKQEAKEKDNLSKQELAKQKEANKQANQGVKNDLALRKQEAREKDNLTKQEMAKQKEVNKQANQDIKNNLALRKQEANEKIANEKLEIEKDKLKRSRDRDAISDERYQKREEEKLRKEQLRAEEKAAKENQRLEDKQQREAEKAARQRIRRLKRILGGFKDFVFGIGSAFINLAGIGAAGVAGAVAYTKEARDRATNVRDFQFETGVGYNDLQRYRRNFTAIGSNMTPEDIMSDLAGVQQNLVDISLGKGSLSGYKLAGVRASAESGSAQRVMESLRQVAQNRSIDNAMLINIMRDMGIKNARDWLLAFRSNIPEDTLKAQTQITSEQEEDILNAQIAIKGFSGALDDLKENITAYISPAMKELAESWKVSVQTFIKEFTGGGYTELKDGVKVLAESLGTLARWVGKATQAYIEFLPTMKKWGEAFGEWIAKHILPTLNFGKEEATAEEQARRAVFKYDRGDYDNLDTAEKRFGAELDSLIETGRTAEAAKSFAKSVVEMDERRNRQSLTSGLIPDKIGGFNTNTKIKPATVVYYSDNHTVNSTVNGIPSEDIADEVIDKINTNDRMRTTKDIGANINLINGLYVLGGTV